MRRGNGDGSIIKLGGKRRRPYAVRVTVGWTLDGKQKYKYVGYYSTKRDANAALREYLVNPYNIEIPNTKLKDIFNAWAKHTKLTDGTIKGYTSAFNQAYTIHNKNIRDVKLYDLENAMYSLKPSMQSAFKNAMHNIYKYACKNEIIDKNISVYLEPEHRDAKKRVPFTIEQIEQIKQFKHKQTDIVVILLYTGLRINELLRIKKTDVNLQQRFMVGGLKTKNGRDRIIPIHDNIFDIVERLHNSNKKYLIEYHGRPVEYGTFLTGYWARLKNHLGTDQTPHCTRHTFVTYADKCKLDNVIVKKIVGHKIGDTTNDVYNHKGINDLLTEINKLEYK